MNKRDMLWKLNIDSDKMAGWRKVQLARFLLKLTLCSDIFSVDALSVETKATSLFEIILLGYFW